MWQMDFFFPKLPAAWLPLLVFRCRPSTLLLAILAQADGNSWDAAKTGAWTDLIFFKQPRNRGDGPTRMDCNGLQSRCWIQKASENQGTWNDQMFDKWFINKFSEADMEEL